MSKLQRLLLLFCVFIFTATTANADVSPAFVQDRHRPTLDAYLSKSPHLRLAPELLCECNDELAEHRKHEPYFQPYYAVGDINDDGIEDFAVGLIDVRRQPSEPPELSVVVFHGPFSGKIKRGIQVVKSFRVQRAGELISIFQARLEKAGGNRSVRYGARLDLGPGIFGTDDIYVVAFNWKTRKYTVKYFYD